MSELSYPTGKYFSQYFQLLGWLNDRALQQYSQVMTAAE